MVRPTRSSSSPSPSRPTPCSLPPGRWARSARPFRSGKRYALQAISTSDRPRTLRTSYVRVGSLVRSGPAGVIYLPGLSMGMKRFRQACRRWSREQACSGHNRSNFQMPTTMSWAPPSGAWVARARASMSCIPRLPSRWWHSQPDTRLSSCAEGLPLTLRGVCISEDGPWRERKPPTRADTRDGTNLKMLPVGGRRFLYEHRLRS
jgi:hypothetical protein